jgi:hypothetical protein
LCAATTTTSSASTISTSGLMTTTVSPILSTPPTATNSNSTFNVVLIAEVIGGCVVAIIIVVIVIITVCRRRRREKQPLDDVDADTHEFNTVTTARSDMRSDAATGSISDDLPKQRSDAAYQVIPSSTAMGEYGSVFPQINYERGDVAGFQTS